MPNKTTNKTTSRKPTSSRKAAHAKNVIKKANGKFDLATWIAKLPREAADMLPNMPVQVAVVEAEKLSAGVKKLRARFEKLPTFDMSYFDQLPELINAMMDAEKNWLKARAEKADASLKKTREDAETLRKEVMEAARYLLRNDPKMQQRLEYIAEGDDLPDLIDDLRNLADIAAEHATELDADDTLPDNLPLTLRQMATTLAEGTDSSDALEAQSTRNLVFAALNHAVTEIRAATKFLLRDQPKILAPLLSQYAAGKMRKARKAKAETKPEQEKEIPKSALI